MAEHFLRLSDAERAEALGVAAFASGRPADLLEKDVWVVWALDALFHSPHGEHLRFKGGTSLSKVYGAIARFSEDIDVTYDIRALLPDLTGVADEPLPASRSQEKKCTDAVRRRVGRMGRLRCRGPWRVAPGAGGGGPVSAARGLRADDPGRPSRGKRASLRGDHPTLPRA